MENLSEQTDAEKAGNAVKQTVKTNIGQIAEIGENAENAEETAQATERAEFGLDGLVADVNIPRGTVVLAATPIGNTGDASARLIALMEGADIVAAEDTRRLYALANRLGIRVPGRVVAYHDHNERDKADGLLDQVEQGATVLVVSDAGMPTINDPDWRSSAAPSNAACPSPALPARPQCWTRCAFQDCPPTASAMKDSCRASIPNACNTCVPCVLNAAPSCFTKPCIASTIPWPTCLTCSVRTARWRFAVNLPRILSRSVAEPSRRFARA
mgnify:CR=1 FL=1